MGTQLPLPKKVVCLSVCQSICLSCSVLSCPQFSAHVCCGQTAGWIRMPLGTMVDLGPGNIVLDADPAPPPRGTAPSRFRPMSIVIKRLDGSRCYLVRRLALAQAALSYLGIQLPASERGTAPNFRPMSIVAKWSSISATAEHLFSAGTKYLFVSERKLC